MLDFLWRALCLFVMAHRQASAQAPTIEATSIFGKGIGLSTPGSMSSLLGTMPGSSGMTFGMQPGRDDMILGAGWAWVRLVFRLRSRPREACIRGRHSAGNRRATALPVPPAHFTERWSFPRTKEEGPPDGLTLDQAIELLVAAESRPSAKQLWRSPRLRADVLTASLRANPILYADSQLVPYGTNSVRKPDGPTQYDLNVSHPSTIRTSGERGWLMRRARSR